MNIQGHRCSPITGGTLCRDPHARADVQLDYLGGLVGAYPWALFPNYVGASELVVAGLVLPGEQEVGIQLAAYGPKGQLLVDFHSEMATNSSQKAFGCPVEPAPV